MVSIKNLNESLSRLYEDINNNLTINIRRSSLNEDIEINWPEVIFNKSEIESAAYKALTDSGLSEEVIESIDLDYDELVVRFDMYDAMWPLADIENDGGLYNVFLSIFNEYLGRAAEDNEDFNESLTEARNTANDEVNDVIRRNKKTPKSKMSDEDKQILRDNGIKVHGHKNGRPEFRGKGRSFQIQQGSPRSDQLVSTSRGTNTSDLDLDNPNFDIKGWLDTDRAETSSSRAPKEKGYDRTKWWVDQYRKGERFADEAEQRGRKQRKQVEADIENELLDSPDEGIRPRRWTKEDDIDFLMNNSGANYNYKNARLARERNKEIAKRLKREHGVYESLNESVVTINPAKYPEFIDAIEDIQNWIEDYEIDFQDVLYDVFNHSPGSKFGDFIINLRNEYRDEE